MKFESASDVRDVVGYMRDTDITLRSQNRARIDSLFNGEPPFSDSEASENHIDCNVNFLEAATIAHRARQTWTNAFLKPGVFFKVTLDSGPIHKRGEWGHRITTHLNKPLKASRRYMESLRATGAQVVLHGIGPVWWPNSKGWRPDEIGIEDLLVPSSTRVNLDNLSHFAIYQQFTPGELYRMTHGKRVDPGWNKPMVDKELRRVSKELMRAQDSYQDMLNPEKIVEFYKSNDGFLDTDRVPTVDCWSFFFQDDRDAQGKWYKRMILDDSAYEGEGFLYEPRRPFAGALDQLLHIQFGDGANVAPFRYHSVRSLGFLLFATCHLQNRLRCRFADAIFEATLMYFRNVNAEDRARLEKIDLQHMGLIPEGLQLVPQAERWQVNEELVLAGLAQNRQLMSENASAFVQDVDQGQSGKELTATEVMARLNSANALVSSLLSMAYTYQEYQYREIARRFTVRGSSDPDVRAFQAACAKDGIPEEYLVIERWGIEPERVMGGGNKTLELAQAKSLLEIGPQLDPPAQREVRRNYVLAVTDDADMALRLVPDAQQEIGQAAHDAQLAVGSLMTGAPVGVRQSIDHISYVDAFLGSLVFVVQDIEHLAQNGEQPTGQQIVGLVNCQRHVAQHMQIVAQDPQEKERVRKWGQVLGEIGNKVKAWGQQLDEEREKRAQEANGAEHAAKLYEARVKGQIAQADHVGKERRANQKLALDARRKDAQVKADIQRKNAQAGAEVRRTAVETAAHVEALDAKTAAEVRAKNRLKSFAE